MCCSLSLFFISVFLFLSFHPSLCFYLSASPLSPLLFNSVCVSLSLFSHFSLSLPLYALSLSLCLSLVPSLCTLSLPLSPCHLPVVIPAGVVMVRLFFFPPYTAVRTKAHTLDTTHTTRTPHT